MLNAIKHQVAVLYWYNLEELIYFMAVFLFVYVVLWCI